MGVLVVGRRGDRVHHRLVPHLAPSARRWAPTAALLVANLSHRLVESTDWEFSEFSHYDLGQAVAHLTLQAQALGLSVRQFRAFDRDALAAELEVPAHWEVTSMAAVGRPSPADEPPPGGAPSRQRRRLEEILWVPLDEPSEPRDVTDAPGRGSLAVGGREQPLPDLPHRGP